MSTHTGTTITNLQQIVSRAQEDAKRKDEHFENNSALHSYLMGLAGRILEEADKPTDTKLPHTEFMEAVNIKRGMIKAVGLIQEEAVELNRPQAKGQNL